MIKNKIILIILTIMLFNNIFAAEPLSFEEIENNNPTEKAPLSFDKIEETQINENLENKDSTEKAPLTFEEIEIEKKKIIEKTNTENDKDTITTSTTTKNNKGTPIWLISALAILFISFGIIVYYIKKPSNK